MIKTKFRLFIVAVFGVQATFAQWVSPKFTYLNTNSGLSTIRSNKYWAPTIADLDRDGNYDLILCNHGGGKTVDVGVSISVITSYSIHYTKLYEKGINLKLQFARLAELHLITYSEQKPFLKLLKEKYPQRKML